MTTQKLSDEGLCILINGLNPHPFRELLIELRESRAKLARVEELVAALEPIASRIKSLEEGLGGLAKYANAGTCEIKIQLLRDARLALENWRKS